MKICTNCLEERPEEQFYRDKNREDGLQPWCKPCRRIVDRAHYLDTREWVLEREWRGSLRRRYHMSPERYFELLDAQNGVCKICEKPEPTQRQLCVDHDHRCCPGETSCGKCVRGLLCSKCNKALGLLLDNAHIIERALIYVRNFNPPPTNHGTEI